MVARIQSLGSCLVVLTLLLFAGSVGAQDVACDPEFSVCDDPVDLCAIDGVPIDCDDSDPCTYDYCDPATGLCLHVEIPGCDSSFDEVVVVPGVIVTVEVLGGPPSPGGVEISFDDTSGGTFIAELISSAISDLGEVIASIEEFDHLDFSPITEPVLFWDFVYDGSLPGTVTLVFGYDESSIVSPFEESDLAIFHYTGGEWTELTGSIDEVGNTITVSVDSFSYFALGASSIPQVPSVNTLGLAVLCSLVGLASWRRLRR